MEGAWQGAGLLLAVHDLRMFLLLCHAGAHLRVEKDAAEWFIILGGPQVVWSMYK